MTLIASQVHKFLPIPAASLWLLPTECFPKGVFLFSSLRYCSPMNESLEKQTLKKRSAKVFLCYSHKDCDAIQALYARLKKAGVEAWLDKEKLLPGQDWAYEIRRAILKSDIVIVCLSRQFNKHKGYRHEELRIALEKANLFSEDEIFIIPARLEKCDVPESLRRWHRVDLFEVDGYRKLMHSLQSSFHQKLA
jgi:hypothetical protein